MNAVGSASDRNMSALGPDTANGSVYFHEQEAFHSFPKLDGSRIGIEREFTIKLNSIVGPY